MDGPDITAGALSPEDLDKLLLVKMEFNGVLPLTTLFGPDPPEDGDMSTVIYIKLPSVTMVKFGV